MKTRPLGVELFHADKRMNERMYWHDEADGRFSQFCEFA
jgi:hypothetical protein